MNDLRFALRQLLKNPGFTVVAVLTLALGIGANTAIYSLIYALMLRALPVPRPEELRFIAQQTPDGKVMGISYPAYQLLHDRSRSFAALGSVGVPGPLLTSTPDGGLETVRREYASSGYFAALGLRPAAGRFFTHDEDRTPSSLVVISHAFWRRHYHTSPQAIGAPFDKMGKPFTIIGVAPEGFTGITPEFATEVWFQESDGRIGVANVDAWEDWYPVLGRLNPGVSERQAMAEIAVIYQGYLQERTRTLPATERGSFLQRRIVLTRGGAGDSRLGHRMQKPLAVLMAMVAMVLLLACANIASMLQARAAARAREIAIRLAIGASRRRVVQQLLVESLLLSALGGCVGLLFANWGTNALAGAYGTTIDVSPDLRVLAFTVAVSLAAGLLFGLGPALQATRRGVAPVLKGIHPTARTSAGNAGGLLVIAQVALAVLLVVGAGLFARTLANFKSLDMGFNREQVVIADVVTPRGYGPEADPALWRLIDTIRALPGVVSAAGGTVPADTPLHAVEVDGQPARPGEKPVAQFRDVTDGFFQTLGTPLLQGRVYERRDCRTNAAVAIVYARFARRFLGIGSPLGQRVNVIEPYRNSSVGRFEIVGVVGDARYATPKTRPVPEIFTASSRLWGGRLLIRTSHPRALMATLPRLVRENEPDLRVLGTDTLDAAIDQSLAQDWMLAGLSGFFGLLALLLASLGVFGVISQAVGQRTRELGIRMALGAQRVSVLWLVLRRTLTLLGLGLAIGLVLTLAAGRLVTSLLYGLEPADPATLITAILVLAGLGLLAGYLPARRAAKVDPMVALRCE